MTRIAGSAEAKRKLLANLNPQSFPYLVGDLLYFHLGHRDVKVMDGPGDGKRDIHSITPNGDRFITQCKFHEDPDKSVGTAETNELVIALSKFGTHEGLFATTAKLSPQAKRECLDNFPHFTLSFLDGTEIVDHVLASPVLSAVWVDGGAIISSSTKLAIPFLLRDSKNDMQLSLPPFEEPSSTAGVCISIAEGEVEQTIFRPYRKPVTACKEENGGLYLSCYEAIITGNVVLHKLPEYMDSVLELLGQHLKPDSAVQVRFGMPSRKSHDESNPQDRVIVANSVPTTFVVKDGECWLEKDYLLPPEGRLWQFPENLSTLEAPWAGWLNRELECVLKLSLNQDGDQERSFHDEQIYGLKDGWFHASIFLAGGASVINSLIASLGENNAPSGTMQYGYGGKAVYWESPYVQADRSWQVSYRVQKNGQYIAEGVDTKELERFFNFKKRVLGGAKRLGLEVLSYDKFKHVAALNGKELNKKQSATSYSSAELYHMFELVPSPAHISNLNLTFVQVFELADDIDNPMARLECVRRCTTIPGELFMEIKTAPKCGKPFLRASITMKNSESVRIEDWLSLNEGYIANQLALLRQGIESIFSSALLSTVRFWRDEEGFNISDTEFSGNPWLMLGDRKYTWDEGLQIMEQQKQK
jgi:hypothetical protein